MNEPEIEIIWRNGESRDFLTDVKSFARFLDNYQIVWDLTHESRGKFVYLAPGSYRVLDSDEGGAYSCPECGETVFDVMEGKFEGKSALGLFCINCESYGAVFPEGLN